MLDQIPTAALFGALLLLIALSAFFAGAETGLISLNRHRLRHLVRAGHGGARRAARLLERLDRLIGLILLGGNFVDALATALATVIALRLAGEVGVVVAAAVLACVRLVFGQVAPKTLAALYPERLAYPASYVLEPLLKVFQPVVAAVNTVTALFLRLFNVPAQASGARLLSREELRTTVAEAGSLLPCGHQKMLLSVLDLEKVTVEDIMVPRHDIVGIDLGDAWETVLEQLQGSRHTRLPVFEGSIDNVVGFVHLRHVLALQRASRLTREDFMGVVHEPYFIPEGTPLSTQLLNFQKRKRRIGLVVDEYGDIRGLVTLDDLLEEIVGEFTTDTPAMVKEVHPQEDGTYLVEGGANIRDLNRLMSWELPADGPRTLNGLVLEYLESIPEAGTSVLIAGYPIEIIQTSASAIKTVRLDPTYRVRRPRAASSTADAARRDPLRP